MSLTFKIAWRNIWKHKGKSLVIGFILFIGALLMTVGNGIISGMEQGMADNIVKLFTGDIVLISDEQESDAVLFGNMGGKPLKVIKNFEAAQKILAQETMIEQYLPVAGGMVMVLNEASEMEHTMLLGIDIHKYQQMFPDSFRLTEGRLFKPGERGILISEKYRKESYGLMDFWILPEDGELQKNNLTKEALAAADNLEFKRNLVFMGASTSNSTVDVRVPVKGIISYKSLNELWGHYCIVDIETFREAHNYLTGSQPVVQLSTEQETLLQDDSLDSFFGTDAVIEEQTTSEENYSVESLQELTKKEATTVYNPDAGSYNLVFIRLKKDVSQKEAVAQLNESFQKEKLPVRAITWKDAVGVIGSMAVLIKGALFLFILFIFFVAIIVIMNTLSMAALERISEIGMMRAVGARKWFLKKMFVYETGILSFFFGGIGILMGVIIIYILQAARFTTTNEFLQLVYGGDQLNPLFTGSDLLIVVSGLLIVTLIAVLYPLKVVGKIVPLDAIARE